jgi:tRNA(Arg) A34 adenosine deaminase TadA
VLPAPDPSDIVSPELMREPAQHETFMRLALEEATKALQQGEVPVGAVLVRGEEVLASAFNQPIRTVDPTGHAEMIALRAAAKALGNYRLTGTTLYVTLEPCLMCVGALVNARVSSLVYGAAEPKWGSVRSLLDVSSLAVNHRFDVVAGVLEEECRRLVVDFFKVRRERG